MKHGELVYREPYTKAYWLIGSKSASTHERDNIFKCDDFWGEVKRFPATKATIEVPLNPGKDRGVGLLARPQQLHITSPPFHPHRIQHNP